LLFYGIIFHKIGIVYLVSLSILFTYGCALPAPLSYLNYVRMTYDTNQIIKNDLTVMDVVLSKATDMNCQIFNVLDSKEICTEYTNDETI
jgi:hypothetical protein